MTTHRTARLERAARSLGLKALASSLVAFAAIAAIGCDGEAGDTQDAASARLDAARGADGGGEPLDAELPPRDAPGEARVDAAVPAEARPPYAPDFPINLPIPASPPIDPRSDAVVSRLLTNLSATAVQISNHGEVPTLYTASPSDPEYTVRVGYVRDEVSFRVPLGAVVGEGSDYPLLLLDPAHPTFGPYTELRVWQASIDHEARVVTGSGGGLFHYNNDGERLNPDGSPSWSNAFLGAGTGSGLSYLAGLIRPEEIREGRIRHAIRFSYSNCDSSDRFRSPATRTDQPKNCTRPQPPDGERMDMGMRLQLDPSVDCDARTVPGRADTSSETRFLRIFCRALQEYGMVMLDGASPGGLLFYMENEATAGFTGLIGEEISGRFSYIIRHDASPNDGLRRGPTDGIPWSRLRVLAEGAI